MGWLNAFRPACLLDCAYCGASGRFRHAKSFEHLGETLSLYECTTCSTLIYDVRDKGTPAAAPRAEIEPAARRDARYLVEAGLSSRHTAKYVLSALPDLPPQDLRNHLFVDVGAGLGIASYFAKTVFGMPTVTVAPSHMGGFAQEFLGLDVHHVSFGDLPENVLVEMANKPCSLYLDSFVEHLVDPFVALRDMVGRAKVEVVAVIAPDGGVLDFEAPLSDVMPFLAPREHLHLPTRRGMEKLLKRLGFAHVRVDPLDGLLTGIGSRSPIAAQSERTTMLAERLLLENLMRHGDPRVASGAAARLLPVAVFDSNATLMATLRKQLPYEREAEALLRKIDERAWDELPFHLGPSAYWLAVDAWGSGRLTGALSLVRIVAAFADLMAVDCPHLAAPALGFKEAALQLQADMPARPASIELRREPLLEPTAEAFEMAGGGVDCDEASKAEEPDDGETEGPIFAAVKRGVDRGALARVGT